MSDNVVKYRGYVGVVELGFEENLLYARVHGVKDRIVVSRPTLKELEQAFKEAVDTYLEFCEELGEAPEKPFSGKFLVRASEDLHRRATLAALEAGVSFNVWVTQALEARLASPESCQVCACPSGEQSGEDEPLAAYA